MVKKNMLKHACFSLTWSWSRQIGANMPNPSHNWRPDQHKLWTVFEESCIDLSYMMWLRSFTVDRTCAPNKFQCANSGVCINEVMICDGWNNCGDESDEQNCAGSNASVFIILLLLEFLWAFYFFYFDFLYCMRRKSNLEFLRTLHLSA